jgi:predicted CXXCH cytochrome family protein
MKTTAEKTCGNRLAGLVFRHLFAFCCIALAGQNAAAQECILAQQLKDPFIRSDYETVIAAGQTMPRSLSVEVMYDNIQSTSYSEMPTISAHNGNRMLDPISMECITCHDGTLASSINYKVKTAGEEGVTGFNTIAGSHPVGMDYTKYSNNKQFVPFYRLPRNMVLMDGKVACITCHDMLSTNKAYLTVDLNGSGLCFTCHNK